MFNNNFMKNPGYLIDLVIQVRRDILRMVHKVNSGHPGGSLGCTEFLVVLFNSIMKRKKDFDMNGIDEDIFFFRMDTFHLSFTVFWPELVILKLKNSKPFA